MYAPVTLSELPRGQLEEKVRSSWSAALGDDNVPACDVVREVVKILRKLDLDGPEMLKKCITAGAFSKMCNETDTRVTEAVAADFLKGLAQGDDAVLEVRF